MYQPWEGHANLILRRTKPIVDRLHLLIHVTKFHITILCSVFYEQGGICSGRLVGEIRAGPFPSIRPHTFCGARAKAWVPSTLSTRGWSPMPASNSQASASPSSAARMAASARAALRSIPSSCCSLVGKNSRSSGWQYAQQGRCRARGGEAGGSRVGQCKAACNY